MTSLSSPDGAYDEAACSHTPSLVSWNLTRMCNLRCPHCHMEAGPKAEKELTTGVGA